MYLLLILWRLSSTLVPKPYTGLDMMWAIHVQISPKSGLDMTKVYNHIQMEDVVLTSFDIKMKIIRLLNEYWVVSCLVDLVLLFITVIIICK